MFRVALKGVEFGNMGVWSGYSLQQQCGKERCKLNGNDESDMLSSSRQI